MGFLSDTCPNCQGKINKGAKFCPHCGQAAPKGKAKCNACGADIGSAAKFCNQCGSSIEQQRDNADAGNRWVREPNVFAQRIDVPDMLALVDRALLVEPGNKALLFQQDKYCGVLGPGQYNRENFLQRHLPTFTKMLPATRFTPAYMAILVEDADQEVRLRFDDLKTADFQEARAAVFLQVRVADAEKIVAQLLKGQSQLTVDDLTKHLGYEVRGVIRKSLGEIQAKDLMPDTDVRKRFEEDIAVEMKASLAQCGLELSRLRFAEISVPEYEKKIRRPGAEIAIAEDETVLRERAEQIRQRRRELKKQEFISGFQTWKDLEDYVAQVEHETGLKKLLRSDEMAEAAENFDKNELVRRQTFQRLDLELQLEQDRLEGKLRGEIVEEDFQRTARIERLKLEQDLSNDKLAWMSERENKLQESQDDRDQDKADFELAMLMKDRQRESKLKDKREEMLLELEAEDRRLNRDLDADERRVQIDSSQKDADLARRKELLEAASTASTDALVATTEGAQGERLANLAEKRQELEIKKEMTADQLQALNPDASAKESGLLREFMDKQDAQRKEETDRMERLFDKSLEQMGRVASTPTVVQGAPGTAGIPGVAGLPAKVIVCPTVPERKRSGQQILPTLRRPHIGLEKNRLTLTRFCSLTIDRKGRLRIRPIEPI